MIILYVREDTNTHILQIYKAHPWCRVYTETNPYNLSEGRTKRFREAQQV
jgi:hypothetical protein